MKKLSILLILLLFGCSGPGEYVYRHVVEVNSNQPTATIIAEVKINLEAKAKATSQASTSDLVELVETIWP